MVFGIFDVGGAEIVFIGENVIICVITQQQKVLLK